MSTGRDTFTTPSPQVSTLCLGHDMQCHTRSLAYLYKASQYTTMLVLTCQSYFCGPCFLWRTWATIRAGQEMKETHLPRKSSLSGSSSNSSISRCWPECSYTSAWWREAHIDACSSRHVQSIDRLPHAGWENTLVSCVDKWYYYSDCRYKRSPPTPRDTPRLSPRKLRSIWDGGSPWPFCSGTAGCRSAGPHTGQTCPLSALPEIYPSLPDPEPPGSESSELPVETCRAQR